MIYLMQMELRQRMSRYYCNSHTSVSNIFQSGLNHRLHVLEMSVTVNIL